MRSSSFSGSVLRLRASEATKQTKKEQTRTKNLTPLFWYSIEYNTKIATKMLTLMRECKNKGVPHERINGHDAAQLTQILRLWELETAVNSPSFKKLYTYYLRETQAECKRNGHLNQEVGSARENDLKAALKYCLTDRCIVDIPNENVEDCVICENKLSIKHSSSKVGTGSVKAIWTTDQTLAKAYLNKMLTCEPQHFTDMLLSWVEEEAERVTLVCVTAEAMAAAVKKLGVAAFSMPKADTNPRGVSYSPAILKEMMVTAHFKVVMEGVKLSGGEGPIARRLAVAQMVLDSE